MTRTEYQDLPEPKAVALGVAEKRERAFKTKVALLCLVAFYSLLHKLFVPMILKFTVLGESAYAQIDLTFLLPLLLFLVVRSPPLERRPFVFLTVLIIFHALWEIYRVASGAYTGWLNFSHLLSSIPLALICISLVTQWEQTP